MAVDAQYTFRGRVCLIKGKLPPPNPHDYVLIVFTDTGITSIALMKELTVIPPDWPRD